MTIGERIKNRRVELGLTVDDVATRLGKNRATVYRYENGYIEDLPSSVLESVARVLQTTPADLMGWSDNLTAIEASLIEKFRKLDAIERAIVMERIDTLLEKKSDVSTGREVKRDVG